MFNFIRNCQTSGEPIVFYIPGSNLREIQFFCVLPGIWCYQWGFFLCLFFSYFNRYVVKKKGWIVNGNFGTLHKHLNELSQVNTISYPHLRTQWKTRGWILALHICIWKWTQKYGNVRPSTITKDLLICNRFPLEILVVSFREEQGRYQGWLPSLMIWLSKFRW